MAMLPSAPEPQEVTDITAKRPKLPPGEYGEPDTDALVKSITEFSKSPGNHLLIIRPDVGPWSARGFFGFVKAAAKGTRFLSLGVVYEHDRFVPQPAQPEILPISKSYASYAGLVKLQISISSTYGDKKDKFPGYFIMGDSVTTETPTAGKYFNHLRDIEIGWQIKDVVFAAKAGRYGGPHDDKTYSFWKLDLAADEGKASLLLNGKVIQVKANNISRIQPVKFVQSEDANGSLPPWLLDTSTLRHFGDDKAYAVENSVVKTAPTHDNAVWSVRGFYGGTVDNKSIMHLGLIWGRDK